MKCLAFDLGRVLFDFDYSIALNKIKDKIGVSAEKIIHELFYNNFATDFEKGVTAAYDFYLKFKKEFRAEIGYEEFIEVWCDIFSPRYETIDLVDKLRIIYPVYLISNINELHFNFLYKKYPQVFSLFDGLILSYKVKSLKPEKKIYAELKKVSKREYEQIIYIDDRQDLIKEAKDFKLNCILFSDLAKLMNSLHTLEIFIPSDYEKNILSFLKNTISVYKKPLIIGLGNPLMSDDAIGVQITEAIAQSTMLETLSVGVSLENYLGSIRKKNNDFILIIDAAELEEEKSFAYFFPEDINNISLSFTHDASLKLAVEYLQKDKPSDILILAIKIYRCGFREGLSEQAQRIKIILQKFFSRNFPA
jgi:hydrogenase maturation protease